MKFSIPKKPIVIKNKDFQTIIVRVIAITLIVGMLLSPLLALIY